MKLHNTSNRLISGFTLTEVMVTIGILAILVTATAPFTITFYKRFQLDSERSKMVSLLRQARTMSLSTENSQSHGLYIDASNFTIFESGSYADRDTSKDQVFPRETNVTITGDTEFLFRYLTGRTASKSWSLTNGTKTGYIYVNSEGKIDWK